MPPHRVVTVAQKGAVLLDVAIPVHVFDYHGDGRYRHALAGTGRRTIRTSTGLPLATQGGLGLLRNAGTIVIPGYVDVERRRPPEPLLRAVRAAAARGVRLVSICTGAFTLAWAGVLDGRRVTTHWAACDALARMFPKVHVDPGVLYIDDGDVLTSAGVAAGLDLCLHVVRSDHGVAVATEIARRTVVAPHRDGGQAQFIQHALPEPDACVSVEPMMAWALEHLDQQIDLQRMAGVARMSIRTLNRRFRDEAGTTPLQWVLGQRVARAQALLETTTLTIDTVAHRCGFTDAPTLRRHFAPRVGTTPSAYRAAFSSRPAATATKPARTRALLVPASEPTTVTRLGV
jgi:AraC family transcriptional regulator, transcriptional activator FtrA